MKYKNNIFLILTITIISLFIGCKDAYAVNMAYECYYINEEDGTRVHTKREVFGVTIDFFKGELYGAETTLFEPKITVLGVTVPKISESEYIDGCYPYILVLEDDGIVLDVPIAYAIGTKDKIYDIIAAADKKSNKRASYASNTDKNGKQYTYSDYVWSIENEFDPTEDGKPIKDSCTSLFGDKNTEGTLANLIDTALQYVRIIVPILIIIFGILDFSKAVIAAKEDEMRKAQSTFVKRLLIGVAIFFIPLLVELIMKLADIIWEYNACIENIQ